MFGGMEFMKQDQQGAKKSVGIGTILGENATFKGVLTFEGAVRIDGAFEGEIKAEEGEVIVGRKGEVKADIIAGSVIIGGRVEGKIIATRRLELQSQSQLIGDVKTASLVVGEGVFLQGNCSIEQSHVLTPEELGMLDLEEDKLDFYKVVKSKNKLPLAEGVGD